MIDELLLQNLVDGELDDNQIRSLLKAADQVDPAASDSAMWKQIAVAFVENQMLQGGFADFDAGQGWANPCDATASFDQRNTAKRPPTSGSKVSRNRNRVFWTLALAASLLVGVAFFHHQLSPISMPQITPDSASAVANRLPNNGGSAGDRLPAFDHRTLMTLEPDHHLAASQLPKALREKVRQQVPLYNAKRFNKQQLNRLRDTDLTSRWAWVNQVMPGAEITDQMAADYEKAGLEVDQDIEFLSGRLDDGRGYLIPYRTVRFTPGQ